MNKWFSNTKSIEVSRFADNAILYSINTAVCSYLHPIDFLKIDHRKQDRAKVKNNVKPTKTRWKAMGALHQGFQPVNYRA